MDDKKLDDAADNFYMTLKDEQPEQWMLEFWSDLASYSAATGADLDEDDGPNIIEKLQRHAPYRSAEVEELVRAARRISGHCDIEMEGETGFERDVIALRSALAALEANKK